MNPRDPHYPNRVEWLTRPARRQVDDATLQKEIQARGGYGERNLWSGRRIGPSGPSGGEGGKRGGPGGQRSKDASKYRCVLELDVGRTRGSDAKQHVFCLYFAKGCCSQGSACVYLHRLPTAEDEAYSVRDLSADIFGREKRAESEGFRKGAGTLERDNRTLYVNYEGAGAYDLPKIRQLLDANFRVFGPVNNIYIVHNKTIAFVRYDWRSSAEFAKEAMHKQSLVGSTLGEVITARWANEDPNPVAVLAQKRACEEAFGLAVMSSFDALPPEQKQARIMELQLQSALQRGTSVGAYPSTEAQFAERERQQRELEELQRRQAEAEAAGRGDDAEEDIPYIPEDIYEEQQRLVAQQRAAEAAVAAIEPSDGASLSSTGAGAGAARSHWPGHPTAQVGSSAQAAGQEQGVGDEGVAGQESGPFGSEPGAVAGVTSEAPEWERVWSDPELREQMRADPDLRIRMRRQRNEAVYWSAYQAHYTAYASSYGHQAQGQDLGAEQGQEYGWQGYYDWYGGQGSEEQGATAGAEGAGAVAVLQGGWRPTGYGAASAGQAGYRWSNGQEFPGGLAAEPSGGQGGDAERNNGGGAEAAAATATAGTSEAPRAEDGVERGQADGLSLLGTAYGSDEED